MIFLYGNMSSGSVSLARLNLAVLLDLRKSAAFPCEFDEGDGLKNRCKSERKSSIRQVLVSRTLTFCGEVAEWPKAAVCETSFSPLAIGDFS